MNVSEKTAGAYQAVKFSRKCPKCGLRNFVDAKVCKRCESELSRNSTRAKEFQPTLEGVGEVRPFKTGRFLIYGGALAILSVLLWFYVGRVAPATEPVTDESVIARPAPESEQPRKDNAMDSQSDAPAKQVLAGLEHFQQTPKGSMSYEEYDQMLAQLKTDLDNKLPTFVRHDPSDERFRQEVAAALRDYVAAGNWWKTTIRYSKVLNDADRVDRLQVEWGAAQTHLDNAEKLLLH